MNFNRKKIFSTLYWKVSVIFILVLLLFASITLYISIQSARNYSIEVNQKLNWNLARNTVDVVKPNFKNGTVNKESVDDLIHSLMVINPSVEVYLLNPEGKILRYVAPEKVVKLTSVSLEPIRQFLLSTHQSMIMGDDPRNPGEKKTFSSARVIDHNVLTGYYILYWQARNMFPLQRWSSEVISLVYPYVPSSSFCWLPHW